MTLDHSEFIARHHGPIKPADNERHAVSFRAEMVLVLIIIYTAACAALALAFSVDVKIVITAGVSFLAATLIAYLLQKVFKLQSPHDREHDLLQKIFSGSRGARLITDGAENTVYANQKFVTLCEDSGPPSLKALASLFAEGDTFVHFRMLEDKAQRGLTDTIELQSGQDERERWYTITAQPIAGWAGYVHWRIDDVTSRHIIDRSIREEREKLIDFTDNAPVGFFSVDENGRFMFVNTTLARWIGSDIQSLLSAGHIHTYFAKVPDNVAPYDIVSGGGPKQMAEVTMKGPGGKTFQASISQAVVKEAGGAVRTRGVVHDLTAERAIRQALKTSEQRFQRFFDEAPLGIALLNAEGLLEECNPALAAILDYEEQELTGQAFEKLVQGDERAIVAGALAKLSTEKYAIAPVEVTLKGKNSLVIVQLYARKLEGSDHIVLQFIDLTQQKALEEQFVQSQKMQAIGQLAGGVAHDFNNLLTAMIGFCDLLLLRHKPGDPSFADIMQIKQNANRASNLVRQLLAFSRQQTLRPKVQDVTDILTELSHLLRRLIGANIELEVLHGDDLGLIKVDTGQMEQVLINLAVNARDAMGEGGLLTIRTASYNNRKKIKCGEDEMPPGHWVSIKVSDTGHGMPPEVMARIFEPFFTTKDVGQGTGLGLSTVYGIIRQTGGYLNVESTPDQGTSFTIYLPRASEEDADSKESEIIDETPRDLTGTERILLVEDEDAVRTFSARALGNKGYEVVEAHSGDHALEVLADLEDTRIDLMVTDVIMPGMDGPTLATKMREDNPSLKIIFISGYTEEKLKDHMGENIWFLPKPFTLKQLAAKVKEVLGD